MTKHEDASRGEVPHAIEANGREPSSARRGRDVRIKLEALPMSLRAVARDESELGITIEAELPWLKVGSEVSVELPEGPKVGRASWFGVDASRVGAARLRIYVDLSPAGSDPPLHDGSQPRLGGDARRSQRKSWPWLVFTAAAVAAAFTAGWLAPHPVKPELLPSLVERDCSAIERRPQTSFVPAMLPEAEAEIEVVVPFAAPITNTPSKAKQQTR